MATGKKDGDHEGKLEAALEAIRKQKKAIYELIFGAGRDSVAATPPSSQELSSSRVTFMKRVNAWRAIILCTSSAATFGGILILVWYISGIYSFRFENLGFMLAVLFAFTLLECGRQARRYYLWFNFQDGIGPEAPGPKDWPVD